ncbi:DNA-binding transcriptional LysR family regulator [Chitinophaga skermanii]|uniref:DNA-binding transcriptional LysR family regulator n=1 Tax=Chitinophaga skermanii TaxID=331697 RepID=A0A327QPI2_9BACT|nr:LysR family transcriptional regulator [Chitinophaga skermanii]RAJ06489.1 DNA-binding transcriptional LysR family regulator [Chitinophaga skermanii]
MDLQQIKYFLALAKELHFWHTAEKMNITQSALSRHIQALESELDVQLFDRNKRSVKLTAAGQFLKDKWEIELSEIGFIHQFAKQIHLGESGTIRIAYPESISASILPTILQNISSAFPLLKIELLQLSYDNQDEYLLNYKIDLALTRDVAQSSNINERKISTEHLSLIVPVNHPFKKAKDITTASLAQQKFIMSINNNDSSYNRLIHQVFADYKVTPNIVYNCDFGSTILALIRKGLGVSILPSSYMHHETPGVRFIQLPQQTDLYLNWRKDDHNPILANVLKKIGKR